VGYAPASAVASPAVAIANVRPARIPPGVLRRRAANQFVNHDAPQLAYTMRSYREYGSGRNVPVIKPWLPPPA
jgi:hypothetical protein